MVDNPFTKGISHLTGALAAVLAMAVAAPASGQSAGNSEWSKIVAAAKAEGTLVVSHFTDKAIPPILKRFEREFGIKVEASAGRPSAVIPKLLTEQKNGQYNWDILLQPVNNVRLVLEPAGGLDLILPYLVLPEVKDPSNWYGGLTGNVPMKPLYTFFDGFSSLGTGMQVNRDKVSRERLSNWADILKPEWKGKFGIYYPRRPATLSIALACLRPNYTSAAEWESVVRAFFRQKPVAARRVRATVDWLAKGRYDVVVAAGGSYMDGIKRRLKLNVDDPVGDNFCGVTPAGSGRAISVLKNRPHPNAAKVFVNWYLTKDVQDEIVRRFVQQGEERASRRKDASHPDPAYHKKVVQVFHEKWMNGTGLMTTSDEGLALQRRVIKIAKEAGY